MEQWRKNLYTVLITQILSLAGFGFVFPFIPFFIQELGVTEQAQIRLWAGLISSAPALSMAIMAPIWGMLADRWGKKLMLLRAMLAGAVIVLATSFARSVEMVLFLRFFQGALTGTMTASGALIATGTPRKRLSYALGLQASSNFIGISVGPLIGGVAAEIFGYRASFVIGSVLLAAGFMVVLLNIQEVSAPEEESPADRAADSAFRRRHFLTFSFVSLFVLVFMARLSRTVMIPFIPLFIQSVRGTIQGSSAITGLVSAARGVVTALAGLSLARLGDRYPKIRLISLFFLLASLLSIPLFFVNSIGSFILVVVASAYFFGAVQPLLQSSLSERTPAAKRGLLFGLQTSIGNMGWFLAPLIGSAISIRFSIRHVFLAYSVLAFLAFVVSLIIRGIITLREREAVPAAVADNEREGG